MFKNFIKLAYRHFVRSPLTSFIELFGMTAGLTVFLLVLLWVDHETSFDQFNEKADRIYRLEVLRNGQKHCLHSPIVTTMLKNNLPEVEQAVRFRFGGSETDMDFVRDENGNKNFFRTGKQIFVSNDFFNTFTFEFLAGDPKTALAEKNTIVITESLAKSMFGTGEALNKIINDKFIVKGVVKDVSNFHMPFKVLRSFQSLLEHADYANLPSLDFWGFQVHIVYVQLSTNQNLDQIENKITENLVANYPNNLREQTSGAEIKYSLRPLEDIYFNGAEVGERGSAIHGDKKKIVAYVSIAFFTLFLASVNFVNLNSAKALERLKEVGIKKVSGASKADVFFQFFGEVFLLCSVALILALVFTHSLLPFFNHISQTHLSIGQFINPYLLFSMVLGLLIISLASGGLPAFYMSSFVPVLAVKGLHNNKNSGINLKRASLVLQFTITTILLIGTFTAIRQVKFMKNADLAFAENDNTLVAYNFSGHTAEEAALMKRVLLSNPNVLSVSLGWAGATPGKNRSVGRASVSIQCEGIEYKMAQVRVDEDYVKTLGLEMVQGRFFEKGRAEDLGDLYFAPQNMTPNVILNESAVRTMRLENPIGAIMKVRQRKIQVIGVVKDFHLSSVDNPIVPTVFFYATPNPYSGKSPGKATARISTADLGSTVRFIESEVEKIRNKNPNVEFIDDLYERQYISHENFASQISYFTILAILIACMGLLGIATHAIKLRTKEIGVRKIVGASTLEVLRLLAQPFVKNIALSSILAIPIGWVLMDKWLSNYPYRIEQEWWVFALACGLTVVVAVFTIIWQSWRASSVNPARLIRYE